VVTDLAHHERRAVVVVLHLAADVPGWRQELKAGDVGVCGAAKPRVAAAAAAVSVIDAKFLALPLRRNDVVMS